MPIAFACPRCARKLSIGTRKAGSEVGCPACSQRIIVPQPPENKPLPGILIDQVAGEPTAQSPETDAPRLVDDGPVRRDEPRREPELDRRDDEGRYREPEDDYYPPPVRRRKRKVNPAIFLIGALGICTLIMIIAVFSRMNHVAQQNAKNTTKQTFNNQTKSSVARTAAYREPEFQDVAPDSPSLIQTLFGSVLGMVCMLFSLALYFAPSAIAIARRHNNIAPILVVNFFLGWALVGWVIALSWAFTDLKHLEARKRSWL